MDTEELKKLLKNSTSVLVLENGEPAFVIVGYESYKNMALGQEKEIKIHHQPPVVNGNGAQSNDFQRRLGEREAEILEKINKDILALKDEIEKEEKTVSVSGVDL